MGKDPTDKIAPEEQEISALRRENETLSQQVKRLVKAESKLYQYQEELDAQLKEYKDLYDLNKKLNATFSLCDIFNYAIDYLIQNLGYEKGLLFHRHENSEEFQVCALDGYYNKKEKNQVARLTIELAAPLLAPLIKGEEYIICKPDTEDERLRQYREKFLMDEYFIYPLGAHRKPTGLLAFGNTIGKSEFYRRVSDHHGSLFSIGNFTGAITSSMGNCIFYKKLKQALELEKSAQKALRESEQNYRQLSEALEVRVKETVDELRQKDKLLIIQGRQAVMGEMISNIAHQWRQPLNMLGLLAQDLQLAKELGEVSAEAIDTNANKTMEIINYMSKTIDNFRYFFKPDNEKVDFRVSETIEKTLALLKGSFEVHKIRTELTILCDPLVNGYPGELSQAILNIMINARDALVMQQIPDPLITIKLFAEGQQAVLTVADNAGGIPEEIIDRIFEPYFTTKGPEQGTGLGLFMCKTIIEKNMHGTLDARNSAQGAEFRIGIQTA